MTPATWIKKNSTCPVVTAEAIELLKQSVIQYQLSSDNIKQHYIEQIKKNLKERKEKKTFGFSYGKYKDRP